MEGRQLLGLGSGLLGGGPLSSLSTLSTLNTAMKLQQLQNIQKLQQLQKERYCNCDSRPNYNQQGKTIFLEIFLILTSLDSHDHQQSSRPSNTVTVTNNRDQSYEDSNLSSLMLLPSITTLQHLNPCRVLTTTTTTTTLI